MAAAMAFVACEQKEDFGTPEISISAGEIVLSGEAGDTTITVTATRDWTVTVDEAAAEWLAVDPVSGTASTQPATVTLSYFSNDGYDREASVAFSIGMQTKYLTVKQKGTKGSAEALVIYSNDFDKAVSDKTYGSGTSWPYLDQFDGWRNQTGSGAASVVYKFKSASARASSSNNNIWLPKTGGYLSVQDIALNGATNLSLSFGTICGSTGTYKKDFNKNILKVYLSADNAKWFDLSYELTVQDGFDHADATFSVPAGTQKLSVTFEKVSDDVDGYRIDNVNLSVFEGTAAVAVDFAAGVDKSFNDGGASAGGNDNGGNNGGNNGGEVTPPADAIFFESFVSSIGTFTINDKVVPAGMSAVWEYSSEYTCMKATGYVNATQENLAAEGWLISPEIDLSSYTAAFFTFEHAGGYFGTAAEEATVWISKNGGEWVNLPIEASAYPTSWEFKTAGVWDLAAYAGSKIKIAFKYVSTTAKAGTWELRNVSVTATAPKVDDGSAGDIGSGEYNAEITFKDAGYTNAESVDGVAIAIDDNITATFSKASANNAPAYYDSGEAIRMYQNGATLDIQAANGKVIKEIRLTFGSKMYYLVADKGTLSEEAAVRVWTGSESSIKFTANGTDKNHRAYVAKIEVAYE